MAEPVGNQPGNTSNIGHVQILDHAGEANDVPVEATSICIELAIVNDVEVIVCKQISIFSIACMYSYAE